MKRKLVFRESRALLTCLYKMRLIILRLLNIHGGLINLTLYQYKIDKIDKLSFLLVASLPPPHYQKLTLKHIYSGTVALIVIIGLNFSIINY